MKNTLTSPQHIPSTYAGILNDVLAGTWIDPNTGSAPSIPIEAIVIEKSLEGMEAELIAKIHPQQSIAVVCDSFTYEALGKRVIHNIKSLGLQPVQEFVWQKPRCSQEGVEELRQLCPQTDVMVAVGSGTINDSVKYACFLDSRNYSVFPTSPMNAYTTGTASVSFGGFKKSLSCKGAKGVFFDLDILARCPQRLISAAFADVICRTTSQVDWLLSNILFDTAYIETPYSLLAYDETSMIEQAQTIVQGDIDALATLTRIAAIMGLGTSFAGTTHSGSMGEHMVSHYIDMFAGANHPGSSHGEQVGVATLAISQLQNTILNADTPPVLSATEIPTQILKDKFPNHVELMLQETSEKALSHKEADRLNQLFAERWEEIAGRLRQVMLPTQVLFDALSNAKCQRNAEELGLTKDFFAEALIYSRFIRNRFCILDIAGDAGILDGLVSENFN